MTIEERRKALSAKIAEFFNAKSLSVVVPDETMTFSSKLNESSIIDEEPTYQRHVEPKKNYYGNRHEVVKKEPRSKTVAKKGKDIVVSNKMSNSEVTAILSKDRKHRLWDKELYKWTIKDWEELYKLRDEK
jgi:hypothetical protein